MIKYEKNYYFLVIQRSYCEKNEILYIINRLFQIVLNMSIYIILKEKNNQNIIIMYLINH